MMAMLNHVSKTITGQRYVKPKLNLLRSAIEIIAAELERRLMGNGCTDQTRPQIQSFTRINRRAAARQQACYSSTALWTLMS